MQPVIKWAGGKRQLLDNLKKDMPLDIRTYVEPFVEVELCFLILFLRGLLLMILIQN